MVHSTDNAPDPFFVKTGTTPNAALDGAEAGLVGLTGRRRGDSTFQCSSDPSPAGSIGGTLRLPWTITLRYDPPAGPGIRAWVGLRHNAGTTPVNCTYSDGVFPPRPFTVTGSAETPIDIFGIPLNQTYNITVKCDNALTHTENKTF